MQRTGCCTLPLGTIRFLNSLHTLSPQSPEAPGTLLYAIVIPRCQYFPAIIIYFFAERQSSE